MSIRSTIAAFQQQSDATDAKLARNPFSPTYVVPEFDKASEAYGRPPAGSKTESRGKKAGDYVCREVIFLCEMIVKYREWEHEGQSGITFGNLFRVYQAYSDKVVGMLIRARKYKLLIFEGEMLYQGQDNKTVITLLHPLDVIRANLKSTNDPRVCMTFTPPVSS